MIKIINGKRYDTKTASMIESWDNGLGSNDFHNCSEDLYRTSKGNYFIHGDGGAMTRWSESNGNTTWGSSGIEALTFKEVLEWLEEHGFDIPEEAIELKKLVEEA